MLGVVSNCWALFLGLGLIMLGNGLQGSLLGVRAAMEGFSTTITGLVMAGYFVGLIAGCLLVPKLVGRVGHIRTFGALASLASTSILVQAMFVEPWVWSAMRIVTGFSYAGLYIVAELEDYLRGRQLGEVPRLISEAATANGLSKENIIIADSPYAGAQKVVEQLKNADLALLLALSDREQIIELLNQHRAGS